MASNIEVSKTNPNNICESVRPQETKMDEMTGGITEIFALLGKPNTIFSDEDTFNAIKDYLNKYERILYTPISNDIYARHEDQSYIATVISNLDKLVKYASDYRCQDGEDKKLVEDTKKATLKIWDHVNLANQQYVVLKQSDEEYKDKFKENFNEYKEDLTKEMNAQLLTMVSIFTALAFLIFGGISSLDDIFSVSSIPILRLISLGLVWGLCMLNLVFVFLFCVGKMTKLNFKSNDKEDATIFQKYPIVWWCNFVLVSLFLISIWAHFIHQKEIDLGFIRLCATNGCFTIIITLVLVGLIIVGAYFLCTWTDIKIQDKNKK